MAFQFNLTDEDITRLSNEAEAYRKEYKERGFQAGVPICFLGDGTYVFRIYPDHDSRGFARILKRAWIHTGIPIEGDKKLRFWKDDRVNDLFQEAEDAGMEKIFGKQIYQFKSREQAYMMLHYYESSNDEYTKPRTSYGTILSRRQVFAVQEFIAGMYIDDKRAILDPSHPAPGIKLQITRGSGKANVSCGIAGMQKLTLPELEFKDEDGNLIEYAGLDHIYITEQDKISDEDFFKLRVLVRAEIASFRAAGGKAKDKSAEGHRFSDKAAESPGPSQTVSQAIGGPSQSFHASQAGDLQATAAKLANGPPTASQAVVSIEANADGIRCRLADQAKINAKVAEAYPDARFGNKPSKTTAYCLACSFEEECTLATEKRTKAA
jgi:hypothetical protein